MDALLDELQQNVSLYQHILYLLTLVGRSDMSSAYQELCTEWLRRCKDEVCRLDDAFDREFLAHHLWRQLDKFNAWIIPELPTEKMAAPQEPLLLRNFYLHHEDTDKTQAIPKIGRQA